MNNQEPTRPLTGSPSILIPSDMVVPGRSGLPIRGLGVETMKKCTKCGEEKPESGYYGDPTKANPQRMSRICKACVIASTRQSQHNNPVPVELSRERARRYKKNNHQKVLDASRLRYKNHSEELAVKSRDRRLANQDQRIAHNAYRCAVLSGKLVRESCESCGATEDVQGHHDDYSKPLEVRWLCRSCHAILHVSLRRKA